MKKRVISAAVALAIIIPLIIIGGIWFNIGVSVISLIGLYEFISALEREKKIPILIKILTVLCYIFIIISLSKINNFIIPVNCIILPILLCILPSLFFKDKYNCIDALKVYGLVLMLGLSFGSLMIIRNIGYNYFIYIILISTMADTFGHLVGTQIGKYKLCPSISPNKTIEGFVGSFIFSTFISVCFITTFSDLSLLSTIIISGILSIMATMGDLIFSLVKRTFEIKDFGNIMPGHGGVLDRVDSILIVSIAFILIMSIL